MTDQQDPTDLFGLEDANGSYYQDTSNNNNNPNSGDATLTDDSAANQQFYTDPNWTFQDTPPYDTYDSNTFYQEDWNLAQQPELDNGLTPQQQQSAPPQPQQQPAAVAPSSMSAAPSNPPPNAGSIGTTTTTSTLHVRPNGTGPRGLTEEQRQKLQSIAMPAQLHYRSPKSEASPDSAGLVYKSSSISSPEDQSLSSKSNSRKRKSSIDIDDDDDDDLDGHQPVKKTAHNMIEKRYRTNLNDKIAALRDSVPSLRIMSKSARGEDTTEDREELHGLTPAHKLNKATVLSKATEYIRHLEKRNLRLVDENSAMQQRIAAFEKLFMAGAMNGAGSPLQQGTPSTPIQYSQEPNAYTNSAMGTSGRADPQGMIQVPDDMKRIIAAQLVAGQPYPVPPAPYRGNPAMMRQQQIQQQQQQHMQARGWQNTGPYFGKLMVGSLAGLMLLEAVRENEQSNDTPEGRGLFALPIHILRLITSSLNINFMGYYVSGAQVLYSIRVVLLLCCIWWAVIPSLMERKAPSMEGSKQQKQASLKAVPSLASPIHVRRQAWLTAIQTVWVPRHNFFLEAAALGLKTLKLSLRNLIGIHGYQMLTGLTEDQELARVKAWAIALDAQLAGGDVEISKSRLTLTLLASGTLPTTPLRLMLKALHIRVLLWEVGLSGIQLGVFNTFASKLARAKWNEAKQLHRLMTQLRRGGQEQPDDELPDHLAALLEQDCDMVLNPSIVQRAHNLAWNRPTVYNAIGITDGMDTVVDDQAIRSPMDAVAAWWSNMTLQSALTNSLLAKEDNVEAVEQIENDVKLAIRTAPIGSIAQNRALVARALLFEEKRNINIAAALQAIGPVTPILSSNSPSGSPTRSTSSASSTPLKELPPSLIMTTEMRTSLLCAMAIAHLQKFSPPEEPVSIYGVIDQIHPISDMGLLGYTATFKLMDRLASHEFAAEACADTLERLSGTLRIWTGKDCGLEPEVRHQMVERCLAVTRGVVGMGLDTDTGYGSMSENEDEQDISTDSEVTAKQRADPTSLDTA